MNPLDNKEKNPPISFNLSGYFWFKDRLYISGYKAGSKDVCTRYVVFVGDEVRRRFYVKAPSYIDIKSTETYVSKKIETINETQQNCNRGSDMSSECEVKAKCGVSYYPFLLYQSDALNSSRYMKESGCSLWEIQCIECDKKSEELDVALKIENYCRKEIAKHRKNLMEDDADSNNNNNNDDVCNAEKQIEFYELGVSPILRFTMDTGCRFLKPVSVCDYIKTGEVDVNSKSEHVNVLPKFVRKCNMVYMITRSFRCIRPINDPLMPCDDRDNNSNNNNNNSKIGPHPISCMSLTYRYDILFEFNKDVSLSDKEKYVNVQDIMDLKRKLYSKRGVSERNLDCMLPTIKNMSVSSMNCGPEESCDSIFKHTLIDDHVKMKEERNLEYEKIFAFDDECSDEEIRKISNDMAFIFQKEYIPRDVVLSSGDVFNTANSAVMETLEMLLSMSMCYGNIVSWDIARTRLPEMIFSKFLYHVCRQQLPQFINTVIKACFLGCSPVLYQTLYHYLMGECSGRKIVSMIRNLFGMMDIRDMALSENKNGPATLEEYTSRIFGLNTPTNEDDIYGTNSADKELYEKKGGDLLSAFSSKNADVVRIIQKETKFVERTEELCSIFGAPSSKIWNMKSTDMAYSLFMHYSSEISKGKAYQWPACGEDNKRFLINSHLPSEIQKNSKWVPKTSKRNKKNKFVGGYVFEGKKGLTTSPGFVVDFTSNYPNCIKTLNICPSTLIQYKDNVMDMHDGDDKNNTDPQYHSISVNTKGLKDELGIRDSNKSRSSVGSGSGSGSGSDDSNDECGSSDSSCSSDDSSVETAAVYKTSKLNNNNNNNNNNKKSEVNHPDVVIKYSKARLGLVPYIIKNLINTRQAIKDKIAATDKSGKNVIASLKKREMSIKKATNMIYGVLSAGHKYMKLMKVLSASVASAGRVCMKIAVDLASKLGTVVYGDSDSVAVALDRSKRENGVSTPSYIKNTALKLCDDVNEQVGRALLGDAEYSASSIRLSYERSFRHMYVLHKKQYIMEPLLDSNSPEFIYKGTPNTKRTTSTIEKNIYEMCFRIINDTYIKDRNKTRATRRQCVDKCMKAVTDIIVCYCSSGSKVWPSEIGFTPNLTNEIKAISMNPYLWSPASYIFRDVQADICKSQRNLDMLSYYKKSMKRDEKEYLNKIYKVSQSTIDKRSLMSRDGIPMFVATANIVGYFIKSPEHFGLKPKRDFSYGVFLDSELNEAASRNLAKMKSEYCTSCRKKYGHPMSAMEESHIRDERKPVPLEDAISQGMIINFSHYIKVLKTHLISLIAPMFNESVKSEISSGISKVMDQLRELCVRSITDSNDINAINEDNIRKRKRYGDDDDENDPNNNNNQDREYLDDNPSLQLKHIDEIMDDSKKKMSEHIFNACAYCISGCDTRNLDGIEIEDLFLSCYNRSCKVMYDKFALQCASNHL